MAMQIGLRNMGLGGTYRRGTPFLVTSMTNDKKKMSKALHRRHGLAKVLLTLGRAVNGRVFFQIEDRTNPASVQMRVFGYGPATKKTGFTIERNKKAKSGK